MDSRIEKTILYISKDHRTELVLEDLAKESGLSKFHFHRLFKAETGLTPLGYITKIKMEFAAHFLIMFPNSKQLEVAFESGYSSPSVFARAFKIYHKQSAIAYRKERIGKVVIHKSKSHLQFEVTYLPQKRIQVKSSNLLVDNLNKLYKTLINKNKLKSKSIGFFLDAPMHSALKEARYYGGLEDESTNDSKTFFDIEEGYYAYFNIQGNFDRVTQQIISFKEKYIDPSPYFIASLIGFEKIKIPAEASGFDYFSINRTIYLKIKRQ